MAHGKKKISDKGIASATAKNTIEPKRGQGCWIAREMEVDVDWPSREGRPVDVIGIYNRETKEFKWHESVGDVLEAHCEENPDDDYDELYSVYMREAEDWAKVHNAEGY